MLKKVLLFMAVLVLFATTAFASVNINTANQETLQSLPGIGPARAEAIVEYRETNGNFNSIEELVNVPGVGARSFEALRELITVE